MAILISGRGSTMQALLDMASQLRCVLVVSSKASAPGLWRARRQGIPTLILDKVPDYEKLDFELRRRRVDRIFLAGFMKIVPESFIRNWAGKIVNVHPSLLPAYPGLKAFEKSFEAQDDLGATLHQVTELLDAGPVLRQKRFFNKQSAALVLKRAQTYLSICEQALVREVSKIWK